MSLSWPLFIDWSTPSLSHMGTLLRASHGTSLAWFCLLSFPRFGKDPKFQILNTCKSRQIHITSKNNTNSTINTHSDIHFTPSYILVDELVWPAGSGQLCLEYLRLSVFFLQAFLKMGGLYENAGGYISKLPAKFNCPKIRYVWKISMNLLCTLCRAKGHA